MDALKSLGAFLIHLLVVVVCLAALIGGVVLGVRWVLGQHDSNVVRGVTVQADKDARGADTHHASDAASQRPADVARGARAQKALDDLEHQADQDKPVDVGADWIRSTWGEPAHANP